MTKRSSIEQSEISEIIEKYLQNFHDSIAFARDYSSLPNNFAESILSCYQGIIDQARSDNFQKLPLTDASMRLLDSCAAMAFTKQLFFEDGSGLVIAGFGESEIFPSLITYDVKGVLNNTVIFDQGKRNSVSSADGAVVVPFAQKEVVHAFIRGTDPDIKRMVENYADRISARSSDRLEALLTGLLPREKVEELVLNLVGELKKANKDFVELLDVEQTVKHIRPFISTVEHLPKDELAVLAESLVNLTSLKRRFSTDAETVGGPIDVALISKGDGFIWVKRKHYFKAELNPQFVRNYFKSEGE